MGKNKKDKKGNKSVKPEDEAREAVETLSLEPGPSTAEEEGPVGGARAKRMQKKKEKLEAKLAATKESTPADSTHSKESTPADSTHSKESTPADSTQSRESTPADRTQFKEPTPGDTTQSKESTSADTTQSKKSDPAENDGLGLGLGGAKRNRRKPKKSMPATDAQACDQAPAPTLAPAPAPTQVPAQAPAPTQVPAQAPAPAQSQSVPVQGGAPAEGGRASHGWPQAARTVQPVDPRHGGPQAARTVQPVDPRHGGPQAARTVQPVDPRHGGPQAARTVQPVDPRHGGPQAARTVQPVDPRHGGPQAAHMTQPVDPRHGGPQAARMTQPVDPRGGPASAPKPAEGPAFAIPAKVPGGRVPARLRPVLTNYLPMTIKALKVNRYDVSVTPDRPKKFFGRAVTSVLEKHFPLSLAAYDQNKIMFCVHPLKDISDTDRRSFQTQLTDDNGRVIKYEVTLKQTGVVDLGTIFRYMENGTSTNPPTEAIQCIDVVLRQGTLQRYIKAGRTFFMRPRAPVDLSDGQEMWTGLFQSAIFTSKAYINIDVAHKAFPKQQPMIDVLKVFGFDPRKPVEGQRGNLHGLQTFVKGLRVVATVGGKAPGSMRREFICNEMIESPLKKMFPFTDEKGKTRTMSVAEYFVKEKKCRLDYPELNCMWVGPRDKTIFYPMELLEVSYGQVLNRQLTERQLSTMVRHAATPPDVRKEKIHQVIQNMEYSKNKYFEHFGLKIAERFSEVSAKVLAPPRLQYGGQTVDPRNGQWQYRRLLQGAELSRWGVAALLLDARECNAEASIKMLQSCGQDMGLRMAAPSLLRYGVQPRELERVLQEAASLQLLFVVVPTRGPRDLYSKVKQFAERRVGILTQCVKDTTLGRINNQTARNILLKVNSKLMGVNQGLLESCLPPCLQGGGVMVVGADVTHPSPDQANIPSIAAVTASVDTKCFQYNIALSIQTPKKEMIVQFEEMMVEHMNLFRKRQRALPRKIYVFRDGVSEGQFAQVMQSELRAIYSAYQRLNNGTGKPQVLFLLVQKRHHTRLFSTDRVTQNVEPGTVVDTDIVHARELDFYLVSHQAIKGTARPTRYHAVCNDGRLPSDEVEQLAFYLCHLYSRCARSVSYPTPTYYAHLACLRARVLTQGQKFDNAALDKEPVRLRVLEKMLSTSLMFFV